MEPSTYKVSSLVEKCRKGEFILPEIQRAFVWKRTQIRDLVDSLYRDYPTGSILAWETDDPPKARTIGNGSLQRAGSAELLILDGQQRLTALLSIFDGSMPGNSNRPLDIRFNLDTEEFIIGKASSSGPWVSVTEVLDQGAIATAQRLNLFNNANVNEYVGRLNQLERIKEYTYQVYILRRLDYAQVTDIFQRVNSKGTRLQQSELAIAELAFRLPGFISQEMNKSRDKMAKHGFTFRLPFFVRCLHAVISPQPQANFKLFQEELKKNGSLGSFVVNGWRGTLNRK